MRFYRFYTGTDIELKHDLWVHDERLLHQWNRVLRFRPGQEIALFDGISRERLYRIKELSGSEVHLLQVTDLGRQLPSKEIYLLWALLKKDKNDWVLQKCTELGISHLLPIVADRSEKTGFNLDRAKKIVIEASEQCGRGDTPSLREPMLVATAVDQLAGRMPLFVCEQGSDDEPPDTNKLGLLIGPEGGWSDTEKELFKKFRLKHFHLNAFTLRAETAAVTAAAKLL